MSVVFGGASDMFTERRRSPRIEILGRLHGHSVSLGAPVIIREISLGGMAVETPFEFPVGIVHAFRLTLGDGATVDLNGRVLRCRSLGGASPQYLSGIQFVDEEPGSPIAALITKIQ